MRILAKKRARSPASATLARPSMAPPTPLRKELMLNEPGDSYEREADRISDQVVTKPSHHVGNDARPHIRRVDRPEMSHVQAAPASVNDALAEPGQPLQPTLRRDMETRFANDFSSVRVHSGATAQRSARDVNARAYTLGHDIVLGSGASHHGTHAGRQLIAHELTHVIQQTGGGSRGVVPGHANMIMRDTGGRIPPDKQDNDKPPEWVLSILADRYLSLPTMLRAMAMGAGFVEFEPKGEDEFVGDLAAGAVPDPNVDKTGVSSEEAGKQLPELIARSGAVNKARSLMGADWHAPEGSAARKTAHELHSGNPQDIRSKALTGGMVWVFENQDALGKVKEEAARRYRTTRSARERAVMDAVDGLLNGLETSMGRLPSEQQYSPGDAGFAEKAWKRLGSENTKKYLEKVGFPLAWFTTCVTVINPVAEAAGVDTKRWGPLDMFGKKKRFADTQSSGGWIPAENKESPKPGDILIFVTYQKDQKGKPQKEMAKAFFQHVAVLIEPVQKIKNADGSEDGTEQWVTADGGKGFSHNGEDKTATTNRRYNPATQQFISNEQTNLQEAAEGGRFLLGFWSVARLPKVNASGPWKPGRDIAPFLLKKP